MANKNFEVKHGLSVGGTERITSAGAGSLTDLTLSGNLTVNGTTTTLDTTTLQVQDKNIVLNYGTGDTSSTASGAGITIQDAVDSSTDATLLWDASADKFVFSHPINSASYIEATGNISTGANGGRLRAGASNEIQLYFDGSHGHLSNSTGNFTIDAAGEINLDADGGKVRLKDGGTEHLRFVMDNSGALQMYAAVADVDLKIQGLDGSSVIDALTLDMENAGKATFNSDVSIPSHGITLNQAFGSGVPTMTMLGTAANGRAGAIYFQEQGATNTAAIYSTDGAGGNANYGGLLLATYQSDIRFSTGGLSNTRMIIDTNGHVSVNAPSNLDIGGTGPGIALMKDGQVRVGGNDGTNMYTGYQLLLDRMNTPGDGPNLVLGRNGFFKAAIGGIQGASGNSTSAEGNLVFYTATTSAFNERMRIASNSAVYSNPRSTAGFLMAEITKQHLGNDASGTGDITITVVGTNTTGVYDAFQVMLYLNHTGNSAPIEHAQYLIEGYQRSSNVYHVGTTQVAGDSRPISVSTSGLTMTITIQSEGSSTATQGVYARALGNYYGISSIS